MYIDQISIFVENTPGRLADIAAVLAENNIDIRALSVADTSDYGILRLIVDAPEKALGVLKNAGITASVSKVIGACVSDVPGEFAKATRVIADAEISVEYVYAFITPEKGAAFVIFRVDDNDRAIEVLKNNGIRIISQQDVFK